MGNYFSKSSNEIKHDTQAICDITDKKTNIETNSKNTTNRYEFYFFKKPNALYRNTFDDFIKITKPDKIESISFDFDNRMFFKDDDEISIAEQKIIDFAKKLDNLETVELRTERAYFNAKTKEQVNDRFQIHQRFFYQFLRNLPNSGKITVDLRFAHLEFLAMSNDITVSSIILPNPTDITSVYKTIGNNLFNILKSESQSQSKITYNFVLEWLENYDPNYETIHLYDIVCRAKIQKYEFAQWIRLRAPVWIDNPIIRKIIHINFPNTDYRLNEELINLNECDCKSELSQLELYYRSCYYID